MDKKQKEALRRYKKARLAARQQSSSESSSSSSDSDSSYSSSGSDRHRKKKSRQGQSRRSSSSSEDERRKREKREHCQKKLEAKRNHIKRKLKEAKLKKRAAAAAAVLSGHSHRTLSPTTQAKLKKLAERKHLRAQSKERREREREKHREREHRRTHSRSPTKITKIRIHQDVKRQKSPPRMHQMIREKIIIQARTRSHTPSVERERLRHEQKLRHEDLARERERRERERDRAEREAARDKERAEALARCQERQRERERIAREKLRREEEEKKYAGDRSDRLGPRTGEVVYKSRERSMDSDRNRHISKRDVDMDYERERGWPPYEVEGDRRSLAEREDLHRRRDSPGGEHYASRRDMYDDERERAYGRQYLDEPRHARDRETATSGWLPPHELHEREIRESRDFRGGVEHEMRYPDERERGDTMRERTLAGRGDWKTNWAEGSLRGSGERNWGDEAAPHTSRSGFVGGPKRSGANATNVPHGKFASSRERTNSDTDWDGNDSAAEVKGEKLSGGFGAAAAGGGSVGQREAWIEHDQRDPPREKILAGVRPLPQEQFERRWQPDWRDTGEESNLRLGPETGHHLGAPIHHHRAERGRGEFRRGIMHHGFRGHAPGLIGMQGGPGLYGVPRFPKARNMTYTNPNLIKKQQLAAKAAAQASAVAAASTAVAAAKAAAKSTANATTNPGILGQVSGAKAASGGATSDNEKPEAGEILPEHEETKETTAETKTDAESTAAATTAPSTTEKKASGELSEISDSDDDILNKAERRSKTEADEATSETTQKLDEAVANEKNEENLGAVLERVGGNDDEEMLDFEEISDGELEEEARHKGVGDALGVDWASLVAETKRQAENAAQPVAELSTTAKQKWQPHRIILDIGISMRMAGEDYAKRLLADAQQKLQNEQTQLLSSLPPTAAIKTEIKEEICSTADEDSQAALATNMDTTDTENTSQSEKKFDINKTILKSGEDVAWETTNAINVESLHPLACVQVAQRKRILEQRQLFAHACGPNSRALSARQDLRLRRQLCGLPAQEPNFSTPVPVVSDKIKALALAAFKRTLEVK